MRLMRNVENAESLRELNELLGTERNCRKVTVSFNIFLGSYNSIRNRQKEVHQ